MQLSQAICAFKSRRRQKEIDVPEKDAESHYFCFVGNVGLPLETRVPLFGGHCSVLTWGMESREGAAEKVLLGLCQGEARYQPSCTM